MDKLLNTISDVNSAQNLNRFADTDENITAVRSEFVGKPEVCHQLVKHIIYCRRNIDTKHNYTEFCRLLEQYADTLLEHMDVRWLISICDTLADYGTPLERSIAMNIVCVIQSTNITTTVLSTCADSSMLGARMVTDVKYPTWGGMITCDMYTGDTIYNMMCRLDRVIAQHSLLNSIWCRIKTVANQNPERIAEQIICQNHKNPKMRKYFQ